MPEGKLLTEEELLDALNIHVARTAVWRWRKQGMPHVKVGRTVRYDLIAVREWLTAHGTEAEGPTWDWSVWSWVPAGRRADGRTDEAFWYEECRCRNQTDAENIMGLFQKAHPSIHYRVGQTKPTDIPAQTDAYPVQGEG